MRYSIFLKSSMYNKGRTLIMILAIAFSISLLVEILMLGLGLKASIRQVLDGAGIDLRLSPKGSLPFTSNAVMGHAHKIANTIREDPSVQTVTPVYGNIIFVTTNSGSAHPCMGIGIFPEDKQGLYQIVKGLDLSKGDPVYNNGKYDGKSNAEVVISSYMADDMNIKVGDSLSLSRSIDEDGRSYKVKGIVESKFLKPGEHVAYMPISDLQLIHDVIDNDTASNFFIGVKHGEDVNVLKKRLEHKFSSLSIYTNREMVTHFDDSIKLFTRFSFVVSGIGLLLAILLTASVQVISVNERLGEIATLKAIGISKKTISANILLESITLTGIGGSLGIFIGLAFASIMNDVMRRSADVPDDFTFFIFEPSLVLVSVLATVLVGLMAGFYPAYKANGVNIIDVLRERIL